MESILLLCAVVIVICIVASRLSQRLGVPALLLFLALGMLFGSDGLFRIPFDNFEAAERICSVALIFIMFYGGFGTRWEAARPAAARAVVLSTLGVAVTALLTALFCHLALGFSALESFLTGAVISSTDAASVFSILRSKKLGLRNHTASLLEVESGSNDPASYMLTVIALSLMGVGGGGAIPWMIFAQVVFGLGLGAAVAGLSILVLRRLTLSDGLDTIFVVAAALLSFALPAVVGGNGYLGAYLAGILIGNAKIPHKAARLWPLWCFSPLWPGPLRSSCCWPPSAAGYGSVCWCPGRGCGARHLSCLPSWQWPAGPPSATTSFTSCSALPCSRWRCRVHYCLWRRGSWTWWTVLRASAVPSTTTRTSGSST